MIIKCNEDKKVFIQGCTDEFSEFLLHFHLCGQCDVLQDVTFGQMFPEKWNIKRDVLQRGSFYVPLNYLFVKRTFDKYHRKNGFSPE